MAHLEHPAQQMLEEYYSSKKLLIQDRLNRSWMSGDKDMSDFLRGQLAMLSEFLEQKHMFQRYDNLKKEIDDHKGKGANE